jgi:signal transduction histidine kinase
LKTPGFDPLSIAEVICDTTGKSMQLEYAALFLYDGSYVSYEKGRDLQAGQQPIEILNLLYEAVQESSVQISEEYRMRIEECMSNNGIRVDLREKVQYVVPLQGTRGLLGAFILGNKMGHGVVTKADWEILESVTLQARIGIENARMIGELQEHSNTINRLHRKVIQAREEERKRVSRDLHDMVIQSLVGLNMHLEEMKLHSEVIPNIDWETPQKETLRIVSEARRICTDLRPASLDMFGLIPTIRSRIVDLEEHAPFLIHLEVTGDESQVIPEEIAINLYRFFNESLINIQKHANADHVEISIDLYPEEVKIQIKDNGDGFEVPDRLDDLAKNQHFGLVGLQELLTMVGGKINIHSTPGMGSSITACVPLLGLAPRMEF